MKYFYLSSSLATISTQNHEERKSEVVMSDCLEKQAWSSIYGNVSQ